MEYGKLAIFRDIADRDVESMIRCFRMRRGRYAPGASICTYSGDGDEVGVLLRGAAEVVRFDDAGGRTILERLEAGGVFGEALAFTPDLGDCVEVVSNSDSEVLYMEYGHVMKRCEKACPYHSQLVQNMFGLVAEQTKLLSRRVEVLSRRSIREKLLCWFRLCCLDAGGDTFTLPFTLSALADYISADRSAMMRELRNMRRDGLIAMDGRRVTVLTPPHRPSGERF